MKVSKCNPQITASQKEDAYYNLRHKDTKLPKNRVREQLVLDWREILLAVGATKEERTKDPLGFF